MNNDQLHEEAVKLLLDRKSADAHSKTYNQRRKEATAALQPVLMEIWKRLESGESVGGFTSKEAWSESQNITIRWCQAIIAGPKAKAKSLRVVTLKEGTKVIVDGYEMEIVLTPKIYSMNFIKKDKGNMRVTLSLRLVDQSLVIPKVTKAAAKKQAKAQEAEEVKSRTAKHMEAEEAKLVALGYKKAAAQAVTA